MADIWSMFVWLFPHQTSERVSCNPERVLLLNILKFEFRDTAFKYATIARFGILASQEDLCFPFDYINHCSRINLCNR
jgi:hypothetical protein